MAKGILIHNGSVIEGNATPSDVLSGKTFMSENGDDVQTGTLSLTGNASASDVRNGKTFYNTDAKSKQTGTLIPIFTKLGMWASDNSSSYKFTADYDYAVVTACYGRDGSHQEGMWMSVSGCSSTDYGQAKGTISDRSCETGIITKLLLSPKNGNSVSWGSNMSGAKCAVSIVGIKL